MDNRILYLCNGEKTDCKKTHCYKNTDDVPCRYTSDIRFAESFTESKGVYCEKTPPQCNDKYGGK